MYVCNFNILRTVSYPITFFSMFGYFVCVVTSILLALSPKRITIIHCLSFLPQLQTECILIFLLGSMLPFVRWRQLSLCHSVALTLRSSFDSLGC